jgi:serine/threonine protein kinase
MTLNHVQKHEELNSSKYCLTYLYDLKDGDFESIFTNLNRNEYLSMIIQILYALYLMHSNYFFHNDINSKNICYKKTDLTHIKIFNYKVPTYGYIFSLIDFTTVSSTKFNQDAKAKFKIMSNNLVFNDNSVLLFLILNKIIINQVEISSVLILSEILHDITLNKK